MAGFFSLGGKEGLQNKEEEEEEIYNKGFEIWPQFHNNNNNSNYYYSFGVGPSRRINNSSLSSNNNVVDDVVSVSNESTRFGFTVMRASGSSSSSGFGGINCQDCGNQAKKDCPHLRCRTCCKSRGFQCQTHVKSTWVPAAKRREKQQQQQKQHNEQQPQFWGGDHSSRLHRENHGVVPPLAVASLSGTTIGLEQGQFPPELNSQAVFRCVKVRPMDAAEERYAYQTAVNIGGHVFKGILYDQGPDHSPYTNASGTGEGSSGGGGSDAQQLTLTTATTTTGNPFDPSQLYPSPLNAFMAGTQFCPHRS